jgi:DNA-binding CsgD family transcriptional regulator
MKENILNLRNEGKSYNEISKILGCSKGTISYHCSSLKNNEEIVSSNLDIKNKGQIKDDSFLLPEQKIVNKVIELRKQLKTYKEISEEIGINKYVIGKICRKVDLTSKRNYGKITEFTIKEIKEKYKEFKSTRKVASILGISRRSVVKYIDVSVNDKLTEQQLKANRSKQVVDWRARAKKKLVEYKGGECGKCGYNKCLQALEFHHLDPKEKDFTISGKSWSFERLKNEVDKCILVCNRCHTEIHYLDKTEHTERS